MKPLLISRHEEYYILTMRLALEAISALSDGRGSAEDR